MPDAESVDVVLGLIELEGWGEANFSSPKAKVRRVLRIRDWLEPSEAFLSDIWQALRERQARYLRPFLRCEEDLVHRALEGQAPPEYLACLLYSLYGVSDEHRTDPKVFERLAAAAIKNYVQGKVYVFGWPVLPNVQADIAFRVRDVAAATRENFVEAPGERYKDRGVDVIAWRPFDEHAAGEHRSSQIVILAQCAAGKNWRQKTGQLPLKSWTQYVHWACEPLTGFAVPCVIPTALWHDILGSQKGFYSTGYG